MRTAGYLLVLMLLGCANPRQGTEQLLTWSGFKKVPATTAERQKLLVSLPSDKLSKVSRRGMIYYVYPDPSLKIFYVGGQTAYDSYQDLAKDQQAMADTRSDDAVEANAEMISVLDWVD